jgi:hypothetical protein
VAALLPDNYRITMIDMNFKNLKKNDLTDADLVFISAMIVQEKSFIEVVSLCNSLEIPIIAGGPHPKSSYDSKHYLILRYQSFIEF